MLKTERASGDRLLSYLGLSLRAGRLAMGFDSVCDSVRAGKARLILTAADISEGTRRKLSNHLCDFAEIYSTGYTIDQFCAALGKNVAVVAVNDKGFANKIKELLPTDGGAQTDQGEENTYVN